MVHYFYPNQTVYYIKETEHTIASAGVHPSTAGPAASGAVRIISSACQLDMLPEQLYATRDEARTALRTLEKILETSYCEEVATKEDLLRFMMNKNICWYDPHTDWTARQVAQKMAKEYTGLFLHTKSGTHAFTKNKEKIHIPIGSDVFYIHSSTRTIQPARLRSYLRDDQRSYARITAADSDTIITVPVEWVFDQQETALARMDALLEEELNRCCQEIQLEKDLYIFGYSYPLCQGTHCTNAPARQALIQRAREILNVNL